MPCRNISSSDKLINPFNIKQVMLSPIGLKIIWLSPWEVPLVQMLMRSLSPRTVCPMLAFTWSDNDFTILFLLVYFMINLLPFGMLVESFPSMLNLIAIINEFLHFRQNRVEELLKFSVTYFLEILLLQIRIICELIFVESIINPMLL